MADIHFDYKLALEAIAAGVQKVRINPGNIGADGRVKAVVQAARAKGIPLLHGVNSGSVEKEIMAKYGGRRPKRWSRPRSIMRRCWKSLIFMTFACP